MRRRRWRVLVAGAALAAGCAGPPPRGDLPADVPDPARVALHEAPGFRIAVDRGCLDAGEVEALGRELVRARGWVADWLGPALAPGDFRPRGTPRERCPPDWTFGPRPEVGRIDVVVLAEGGRCHADGEGIAVVADHVPRRDATHELAHYLAGSSWRPIDEGLAVYLTERLWGPAKGYPLATRARVYQDLSLETYLTPRELAGGMSRRDYDVAGAFVGWLIASFGKARFLELYAGPGRAYVNAYGLGEHELLERFWAWVADRDVRHDPDYHAFKALLQGE